MAARRDAAVLRGHDQDGPAASERAATGAARHRRRTGHAGDAAAGALFEPHGRRARGTPRVDQGDARDRGRGLTLPPFAGERIIHLSIATSRGWPCPDSVDGWATLPELPAPSRTQPG